MKSQALASQEPGLDRVGYSIPEWCHRLGISRGMYYKLPDPPEVIHIGARVIITEQAHAEWLDRQRAKARDKASA